ncbi:MAG: class I SAM-dependent methyltransferase [Patescibacteria group bacterium]
MKMSPLSREELTTLESYENLALTRSKVINSTPFNRDFWRPEFEKFRKLLPAGRVLDIGCGNGREALLFMDAGYEYTGIDLSQGMLTEARQLAPQAKFLNMNMYNLAFPADRFDGIWNCCTLFHAPKSRVHSALREVRRISRKGAIAFFVVKAGNGERMVEDFRGGNERLFSFYNEMEFADLLEAHGFDVLESSLDLREYNPPQSSNVYLIYFTRVV